jgi:sugar lactone lactonase YvrE
MRLRRTAALLCAALALAPALAGAQLAEGDVLVTGLTTGRVYRLDPNASPPVAPVLVPTGGAFVSPRGLAVDRNGLLLVADNGPKTVERVDASSDARATAAPFLFTTLPRGTVVAGDGRIFVNNPDLTFPAFPQILLVDPAAGAAGVVARLGFLTFPNGLEIESESPELALLVADFGANPATGATEPGRPGRGIYRIFPDVPLGRGDGKANQQVFCAATAFGTPRSLVRDATDGSVYVVDSGDDTRTPIVPPTIWRLPPGGCAAADPLVVVAQGAPLVRPSGIALGDDGLLYVADTTADTVFRVDPGTGAVSAFSTPGSVDGAWEIEIYRRDPSPFFVADAGTDEVLRIDPGVPARSTVASGGALSEPAGLTVLDALAGSVVVADTGSAAVIAAQGGAQVVQSQAARLVRPTAAALESSGTYLVTDLGDPGAVPPIPAAVIRIDPLLPSPGNQELVSEGGALHRPVGAEVDPSGFLIVVDAGDPAVVPPAPRLLRISPVAGPAATGQTTLHTGTPLLAPVSLAIQPDDGTVLVADAGDAAAATPVPPQVLRFVREPAAPGEVSFFVVEASGGRLERPAGIAVDVDHSLLVSDAGTGAAGDGKVVRIDAASGLQTLVPTGGALDRPTGIDVTLAEYPDFDGDGVLDAQDNCFLTANASQTDTDGDLVGNACDADYNNDGEVGGPDFVALGRAFGSTTGGVNFDPRIDANDDGVIGGPEFALLGASFGGGPGPSGLCPIDGSLLACPPSPLP